MANMKQVNNNGIGVLGLLGVVFVTLKLTKVIDWSWWWVTLPFWGGFAVLGVFIVFCLFMALITGQFRGRR